MKKDILKSLLGGFAIGLIGYFTLGVFAQHADVQTTFSQVAGFVSKLIISPEANQNSIKYIGINEDGNGSLEVYRGYAQVKKANIGDAFVEELGARGGSFLRYGSNHASSSSEEVLLKYNTPDPGIKWIGSNYDSKIITINAGKNVNFDDVLVIKDNKVGVNNPNPQVALDISGALKIGRQGSYGGNLYVGSDNLVYLDGQPIVPFYCGNGYVDSNYVDPIGAPDNVDLEECDNGSTNGDGCSNQCQLETPSVSVSASPSYSNNGSLTTTISASTDSWSKLTRINFGDGGSATLDPPERTSYSTSRTYSTSSPDASWTITVYARNNLEEVRNDIGDNDTDRPTASASTTVRVCNPTACAATDYINRSEGSDTTCRDYGTKHLHRCELGSCVEYDTQSVWRAQNDGVSCSAKYCIDNDTVGVKVCNAGYCNEERIDSTCWLGVSCGSCNCSGTQSCTEGIGCSGGSCQTRTYTSSCTPPSSCSTSSSSSTSSTSSTSGGGGSTSSSSSSSSSTSSSSTSSTSTSTSSGGGGCFIKGTKIRLADGTIKNVENVRIGDNLIGRDGRANEVQIIYKIPVRNKVTLYSINNSSYFVTASHPFRTIYGRKAFDPQLAMRESPGLIVTKLKVGDILIKEDGQLEQIFSISYKMFTGVKYVYNFGLNGSKDYFANGYLVHNVNYMPLSPISNAVLAAKDYSQIK